MRKKYYFQILIFLLVVGLCILIFLFKEKIAELEKLGYFGAFLISVLTNATIAVPAPGWVAIAALSVILNPWLVGFLAGLGAALGETTGYLLGYSGKIIFEDSVKYQKAIGWMRRWGGLVIFFLLLFLILLLMWQEQQLVF